MSTRPRKQITGSNAGAFAALVSRKTEIDMMFVLIQVLSGDHFQYSLDDVTWDHVGTVEHDADRLRRIAVMTFNEGEHAA
jgi:hypothetical protein